MRVNSAYNGNFAGWMVTGSSISIVLFAIFFVTASFRKDSDRDVKAKQVNLLIRQIGHRLLLQAGDVSSRVLPVTEIKEGTFLLKFEKEFFFKHDSLIQLSRGSFPKADFPSGYTVIVNDCIKGDIVYGFQVNNSSPDILACSGRSQPAGSYSIEFAFPDFYENIGQSNADIGRLTKPVKDAKDVNLKPEEFSSASFGYNTNQLTESAKVDTHKINPTLEEFKKKNFDSPLSNVVFGSMLVLLCVALFVGRFGKISKPGPVQNESHVLINEPVPQLAALGKFLFDVKGQRLLLGNEVIPLTDKESKVLQLLHKNFGELVPRETLMQEIWINEGVITGRSLDMFISKLRKKLSAAPQLRITNIHSKGYRLEILNEAV